VGLSQQEKQQKPSRAEAARFMFHIEKVFGIGKIVSRALSLKCFDLDWSFIPV